jgi:hypothetical protein
MQTGCEYYVLNIFKHFRNTMPVDPGNHGNQLNYSRLMLPRTDSVYLTYQNRTDSQVEIRTEKSGKNISFATQAGRTYRILKEL